MVKLRRQIILLFFLPLLLAWSIYSMPSNFAADDHNLIDGIAAIVDSQVITTSQVKVLEIQQGQALRQMFTGPELEDKLQQIHKSELNDLINRALILNEAKEKGIHMPDYIIDSMINDVIRTKFGGDRIALLKMLQSQGITMNQFRKQETDAIIVQQIMQSKMKSTYLVPPGNIHTYYDQHPQEFSTPEQIKLRMIALHQEAGAELDDSKKEMADEIHQKLAGGAEFDRMAQMYSDDPSQDNGGDWGWVERSTLNPKLAEVAFSMKPGEISPVTEVDHSYYILMVEKKKAASEKSFSEVKNQIEQKLLQEERLKGQKEWLDELRKKAYIKIFNNN